MRKRVLAAMSGGVDSSLAAALLRDQGYEVIGATMQIWPDVAPEVADDYGGCCSLVAVEDARRVADRLGIPYYVLNLQETFERTVIDDFVAEYTRGRTPNPCLVCNREVKFKALLEKALALGCEYVATGHYARVERDGASGRHLIKKAADRRKDQTYALYTLTQEQLAHVLWPLGGLTKPEVRKLAAAYGLPTANKPESQEICFVMDNDYARFVGERAPEAFVPGPFVDPAGRVIGEHRGLPNYTVGQRKGLGLTSERPYYVVRLEPERNAVVLGHAEDVYSRGLVAAGCNFVSIPDLVGPRAAGIKVRYGADETPGTIEPAGSGDGVRATFDRPQRAVTPGQAAVFYDGETLIGGGTIERALD
ncbi:MAG: tRNA 2-thiouridine(34) synthase MnmA [Bacillota bacterium]